MRKLWYTIRAQFNKLANFFWVMDPIAQMQFEYDRSVDQLKQGRIGLEQYRGLVERVSRQVARLENREQMLAAKIKAYLKVDNRRTAGQLAVQLEETRQDLLENREQLDMHEKAYDNNVEKIKHSSKALAKIQEKIKRYQAELKMSKAEAEMVRLCQTFNFDLTTDFSQMEYIILDKIDVNRGRVRVAADLSEQGLEEVRAEKAMEEEMAEELLKQFEADVGIKPPEYENIEADAEKTASVKNIEIQPDKEEVK
jgi:phage shock protein A